MALFERKKIFDPSATRALSVTAVESAFVEGVYERLAKVYDLTFGPALHPGRLVALEGMGLRPGDSVLEVGIGTGINAPLYPRTATSPESTSPRRCSRRRTSASSAKGFAT